MMFKIFFYIVCTTKSSVLYYPEFTIEQVLSGNVILKKSVYKLYKGILKSKVYAMMRTSAFNIQEQLKPHDFINNLYVV